MVRPRAPGTVRFDFVLRRADHHSLGLPKDRLVFGAQCGGRPIYLIGTGQGWLWPIMARGRGVAVQAESSRAYRTVGRWGLGGP